jgi:hypothetical protein
MPHQLKARKYNENKTLDFYPLFASLVLPFSETFFASHILSLVEKTHKTTTVDLIPLQPPNPTPHAGISEHRRSEQPEREGDE